jgi:glycosyltransferase involved in cell wall biosynthesis
MLGTFPPTQCGLATFAKALTGGFTEIGADVDVVRVVPVAERRPSGVAGHWVIDPGTSPWPTDPVASIATAAMLNRYDVVVVQHEYGIYGGPDGEHLLSLLRRVTVPVVTVLHTVLSRPTPCQHRVLSRVIGASAVVVTMTHTARGRAVQTYGASPDRVVVIPHGAAEDLVARQAPTRPAADDAAPIVLTWGLLGRGKGIEWAIRAMARLTDLSPRPVYVVAGRTHPRLMDRDGSDYRRELVRLAADLGVADMIRFDDRYLDSGALHALVRSADVVLLPYDSVEQVTSGVLSEAIAAAKPVVSTRFPHAMELLADGTGLLVDRGDAEAIALALRRLLTEPQLSQQLSRRAERLGAGLAWSTVAQEYLRVCTSVRRPDIGRPAGTGRATVPAGHRDRDPIGVG